MVGDYDERMAQMRIILQEMVLDGRLEGVQMKLDEIRGLQVAYLSATASATAKAPCPGAAEFHILNPIDSLQYSPGFLINIVVTSEIA